MTLRCANCKNDAVYSLIEPRVSPVHYCARCLPPHLHKLAISGGMRLASETPVTTPVTETPAPKKRRKAKTAPSSATTPEIAPEEFNAAVADGYDSAATDGDGDGRVQDSTPFERPVGDILTSYKEETTEGA